MSKIIVRDNRKNLLESLRDEFNIPIDASCGGNGSCGKCRIRIISGEIEPPGQQEKSLLSPEDLEEGVRLACYVSATTEVHIEVEPHYGSLKILKDHGGYQGQLNRTVKKTFLQLPVPSIDDQHDHRERILSALDKGALSISVELLRSIPSTIKNSDYGVTAVYREGEMLSLEEGNSEKRHYSVACDIGTTTVVAYLLDGNSGDIVGSSGDFNNQKPFGADIIARIQFAQENPDGLKTLQEKILGQLENLIKNLLEKNRISQENLYTVTVAGNTTMLHLLAGVDPTGIAVAPFIPVFLDSFSCRASELGSFFTNCLFYFLPSISAYVGADITAGILATGMFETEDLTLLVDLGTNGEIVLGNREELLSCSTAAGPAFEGAHIQFGMSALSGAINSFSLSDKKIAYTVIGDSPPRGICGSAIVDITSELIKAGIVDETGRLADKEDVEEQWLRDRLADDAFVLVPPEESADGRAVLFTQKDIREIQLAKAAVAAGIQTLLHEKGCPIRDVKHLYLAGGFGNFIQKDSAALIGLIPGELLDRTQSVGNSAGLGAISCALDSYKLSKCREIVAATNYVELSANSWFQQKYMEEMIF